MSHLIPAPYRWLALALLAAALVAFGWVKGAQHGQAKLDALVAKSATEGVRITAARSVVTERIVTQYLPQVERIKVVTETITKEVPTYVKASDPDLSPGFRVLHDAAAAGRVPDPASIPDAAAVPAQDAARTVAENYGACLANAKLLAGLQQWVIEQGAVK